MNRMWRPDKHARASDSPSTFENVKLCSGHIGGSNANVQFVQSVEFGGRLQWPESNNEAVWTSNFRQPDDRTGTAGAGIDGISAFDELSILGGMVRILGVSKMSYAINRAMHRANRRKPPVQPLENRPNDMF